MGFQPQMPSTAFPASPILRQQRPHHVPMHVGQAVVAALLAEGESGVVVAEAMEDVGVAGREPAALSVSV